jgi:SAM-dependent methyltransferase
MDVEQLKDRQRYVWSQGDYSYLGSTLEPAAIALCDACAVSAGQEVLDVAAGDGNFALAAAREGAKVVASDLVPAMLERGRRRSEEQGFEIEWVEADAEALPFEDGRFDCAGSTFGAMIAPRPEVAAAELLRVVRPGGTVGMTAWTPDSFSTAMISIARQFLPQEPGAHQPEEWGDEEAARARFDGLAASVSTERRSLTWSDESVEAMVERFGSTAPPQVAARGVLSDEQLEQMRKQMLEVFGRHNSATDGSAQIEADYLLIVARKRG